MKLDFMEKFFGKDKKKFQSSLLVFAGALGLFLLIAGGFGTSDKSKQTQTDAPKSVAELSTNYTAKMEAKLTQVLANINGAGKVQVAVTLEASAETVYALNQKRDGGADGGLELEHILLDTEGGQDALVEMTWEPVVRGIAVVCEGADDITVNAQITEAVSVLTGVSTNRISIAKMS